MVIQNQDETQSFSKSKKKKQMELIEAQNLLSKAIEASAESKEKGRAFFSRSLRILVVELTKILSQLLSSELTSLEKQAIMTNYFEQGEGGLKLKNHSV